MVVLSKSVDMCVRWMDVDVGVSLMDDGLELQSDLS
jgi:hypothetical protein